jgi:hypothetical protein
MGEERGLGQHQANAMVGGQADPGFLDRHRRGPAAQSFHSQRGPDAA